MLPQWRVGLPFCPLVGTFSESGLELLELFPDDCVYGWCSTSVLIDCRFACSVFVFSEWGLEVLKLVSDKCV